MSRRFSALRLAAGLGLTTGLSILFAVPAFSSANLADDLVHQVTGLTSSSSGGSSPQANTPPSYTPPLHGTNPHGEGTPVTVDLTPSNSVPFSGDPTGGQGEDIVLGRSRGEQNPDGSYHGHVTAAALLGHELLGVDSTPGQTSHGPLDPLQKQLLDQICAGSGNQICLTLLAMDSSTTSSGSTNHFSVATANVGGLKAGVVSSDGNISDDGSCQTSHGESHIANASVGGVLIADVLGASSDSTACNNGTKSASSSSDVVKLNNTGVPVPAAGCGDGTPNITGTVASPLLMTWACNADDTNSGQAVAPYTVREGLTLFVLNAVGGSPLVKATTSGPEALANAPASSTATTPPGGSGGNPGNNASDNTTNNTGTPNDNGNTEGGPNESPASSQANPGNGNLAFTGTNVLLIAMLGFGLLGAGLTLKAGLEARHQRLEA